MRSAPDSTPTCAPDSFGASGIALDSGGVLAIGIGAAADFFCAAKAAEGASPRTVEWYRMILIRAVRRFGDPRPVDAITAAGLWAALDQAYPATAHQRCWNHRAMNLADKLPKRLHAEFRGRFRALYLAPTRVACETARDELAMWLHEHGQDQAAETMFRDWDSFTTFYDFPAEHWLHLRTSNPIESVFAGVRLRTDVAKRARVRENALYLVFKIVERLSIHWRVLNGGQTVMTLVLAGARFSDGILVPQSPRGEVQAA